MAKVYVFIALLFCCLQAAAQTDTAAKKDTVKKKHGQSFEELKKDLAKNNPLYLLNGSDIRDSISKEDFDKLKSEDITSFNVIKSVGASIWGKRGANGVVIIHTKDEVKNLIMANDSGNQPIVPLPHKATRPKSTVKINSTLYVIDGKPISGSNEEALKGVDPSDIFSTSALKGAEAGALYGVTGVKGAVIITTITYVINQNQDKLSGFSKEYAGYLERNKRDESKLTYVLDGRKLTGERLETAKILYDLPIGKIKKVTFVDNSKSPVNLSSILTINTK